MEYISQKVAAYGQFVLAYFNNTENITEHCSNADTTYQIETSGMYEI